MPITAQAISILLGCETFQGGPFSIGGNLYTLGQASDASIFKSTDSGLTWLEMDAGNKILGAVTFTSCATDGTKIYCVFGRRNAGITHVAVKPFNTTTGLWESEVVTTNLCNTFDAGEDPIVNSAYRPSDGQLVIINGVQAFSVGVNFRQGFFLFDVASSTFTAWAPCGYTVVDATVCVNMGIVKGSSPSDLWFIFQVCPTPYPSGGNIPFLLQQLVANVPGALFTVETFVTTTGMTALAPASDNTNWAFAWVDRGNPTFIRVIQGTAGSTAAFTFQNIVVSFHTWALTVTPLGTFLIVNELAGATHPLIYFLDSGGGFGAQQTLLTDAGNTSGFGVVAATNVGLNPIDSMIVLDYQPGGSFQYSFVFFGGTPPPPPISFPIAAGAIHPLPGIGNACKFGRPKRLAGQPPRPMMTGDYIFKGVK